MAAAVKQRADRLGLRVGGLTPYVTELNSLDEEKRQSGTPGWRPPSGLRPHWTVTVSVSTAAPCWAASQPTQCPGSGPVSWTRCASWAPIADAQGVVLCVENHFSTMTVSAADTVSLVEKVGSPGVGILYDQANLAFTRREPYPEAIALQAEWIRHVHVKDPSSCVLIRS